MDIYRSLHSLPVANPLSNGQNILVFFRPPRLIQSFNAPVSSLLAQKKEYFSALSSINRYVAEDLVPGTRVRAVVRASELAAEAAQKKC